jgi:glycosyltransferase involved in cell wall biosynthesis
MTKKIRLSNQPKVAIAHDYFNQYGGGERVAEAMSEVWPEATVYTSVYDKELMKNWLKIPPEKIKTNFINGLPFIRHLHKHYFFFYPLAFRLQNTRDADIVISSSSYAAKFVRVKSGGVHICYLHTPPRFLWGYDTELSRYYVKSFDRYLTPFYKIAVPPIKFLLRSFDYKAAQKVDYFIANSKEVQKRIKKHYGKNSTVIYPPVDSARFAKVSSRQDFYLVVSRLGGYKKVDIAVKAFNKLGLPLKIVGCGPQFDYLKKTAKGNIQLLGRRSDMEVTKLLAGCKALIFPTYEDFGIVPVEAMAAGKPVIAYRSGGAIESVVEGVTGEFFNRQTPDAIIEVVNRFNPSSYDPKACRERAKKFSKETFKRNIKSFVEEAWKNRKTI